MRKNKLFALLLCLVLVCSVLAGCGNGIDSGINNYEATGEITNDATLRESASSGKSSSVKNSENKTETKNEDIKNNRKIIETISYDIQTKEFDKFVSGIEAEVEKLGGYIENSSTRNDSYDNDTKRYATIKIRIPATQKDKFTEYISSNGTVAEKSVETEDITLKYVDTESRLNALKTEKESLEKILEKANNVNDIMSIRKQLTEVIYEIESYQSQLKTYDNLVDYTTFNLSVNEVQNPINPNGKGIGQRIKERFSGSISFVKEFFSSLIVFIIGSSPALILLAVIVLIVVLCVKKYKKKHPKTPKFYAMPPQKPTAPTDKKE